MHVSPVSLRGHGEGQPGAHPQPLGHSPQLSTRAKGWGRGHLMGTGSISRHSRRQSHGTDARGEVGASASPRRGARCLLLLPNLVRTTRCCWKSLPVLPAPTAWAAVKLGELGRVARAITPSVSTEWEFVFREHEQIKIIITSILYKSWQQERVQSPGRAGDAMIVLLADACASTTPIPQGLGAPAPPISAAWPPRGASGAPLSVGKLQQTDVSAPALDTGMSVPQARR